MTFLSKLFKPKWQSKHTATRLTAIKELDPHNLEEQKILVELAQNDAQHAVKKSAIEKLNDAATLISLHSNCQDDLKALIEQKLYEIANTQSLSIFDLILDPKLLTEIIVKSNQADAFLSGLARIEDSHSLFEIATQAKMAKLRQAAAELIETEESLTKLSNEAKGKDKSVYQIAKSKLNSIRQRSQEVEEQQTNISKLVADIKALSQTEALQHFEAKLNNLTTRWESLSTHANSDQTSAFNTHKAACKARLEAMLKEKVEAEEQERLIQTGGDEQEATLFTLSETLKRFETEAPSFHELSAIDGLVKTQENRWIEATRKIKVEKSQVKNYQILMSEIRHYLKSLKTLQEVNEDIVSLTNELNNTSSKNALNLEKSNNELKKLVRQIDWPKDYAYPGILAQAKEALGHSAEVKQQAAANAKEIHAKIEKLIKQLDAALEDRQLKKSSNLLKDVQRQLGKLSSKESDRHHNQLNLYIKQLNELRDWQGYASNPRQLELCEAMERLVDTHQEPREKADKIKQMQKEWKTLGGASDQALWQRFKEAADKAYEPCQAFFGEQNQLKQANIEKRKKLITEVSEFIEKHDWNNANWKAAEKINRQARLEWKEAYPVDFKANKSIQNEFNALLKSFDQKLDAERTKNLELKQAVVDKAAALIEEENLETAINSAKDLQKEWQTIGITPYKKDRELWKSFREACDAIFARRDQARSERKEEVEKSITQANEFCAKLEDYTTTCAEQNLEELNTALSDFRREFKQLPSLPAKALEAIQNRFETAIKQIKSKIATLENKQHLIEWQEVKRKSALCRRLFSDSSLDADALNSEFDSQVELNKSAEDQLKALWISVKAGAVHKDHQVDEDQARSLCIACEIAAGIDSPEMDKERRMQLQVSRLSEGMSSGSEHLSREAQLSASLLDWYTKVGLNESDFAKLDERIEKAISHLFS